MMAPADSSALPLPGVSRTAPREPRDDAAALVAERLAARRRRVRTIRRWVVTCAVTLFIAVGALITAESHLVSASSASGSSSTGGSASTGGSPSSSSGTDAGMGSSSSSSGSASSLTTSQS